MSNTQSKRVTLFKALKRNPKGLGRKEIVKALAVKPNWGSIGIYLRGEQIARRIRMIERAVDTGTYNGDKPVVERIYQLTAKGAKALEEDKVDSEAHRLRLDTLGRTPGATSLRDLDGE